MMRLISLLALLFCPSLSHASPSDSYCVKIGGLTQSVAKVMAAGGLEKDLLQDDGEASNRQRTKTQQKIDAANDKIRRNVISYVFTVKLDAQSARLIGYKKCLAGDFN